MALSEEEKRVRARLAQKKYRETERGRQMRYQAAARYRARNTEKLNAAVRKHNRIRHGASAPTDERRVGPCEICGTHSDPLHYDHNHITGRFRGWLCPLCNKGLGAFRDSPEALTAAAAYLLKDP